MYSRRTELEDTLRSRMNLCRFENIELWKKLKQNLDWYYTQVEQTELKVSEGRLRWDLADDYLYNRAFIAVGRAARFIAKDADIRIALNQLRVNFRNKVKEVMFHSDCLTHM